MPFWLMGVVLACALAAAIELAAFAVSPKPLAVQVAERTAR